jgi:hypothetical protein
MPIRRRRWLISTAIIVTLLAAVGIGIAVRLPLSSDALRSRVVSTLADRLDAEVELGALNLRLYPRLRASGDGLTIRFQRRRNVPPLIAIEHFTIDADLVGLWRRRVARVALTGLAINIPPDSDEAAPTGTAPPAASTWLTPSASTAPDRAVRTESWSADAGYGRDVIIERLDAPDATLTILRADPNKAARVWYLHRLTLRTVGLATTMPFETMLTNAVPPGQIAASGTFGPWSRLDPGATPIAGRFTYDNADLSVFKGISGVLAAKGGFAGTLDRIAVDGQTEMTDFMVNLSGHQVPLRTTYHAVVDATNGNTTLDPVLATVLDTRIQATGGVYDVDGIKGRVVKLAVTIEDGRLEDVMRLAVNTPRAPMLGGLQLTTTLVIPPGPQDIVDKLQLDGRFAIERGRFADPGVQEKVNTLSRRASGKPDVPAATPARVASHFAGRFTLNSGRLTLPTVTFDVPGAVVSLAGSYALERQTLAFAGDLYMDAKISQTTSGFKSLLLKLADPLFRRNGKTVVPLRIHGTRNDPQFGLDVRRVFRR